MAEPEPIEAEPTAPRLRRTPRQARAKDKVARALEAADRLLAEEGLNALTITRVAAEAGVSVGALYQYLPDRDAIVEALADQHLSRLQALMNSFVATAHPDDQSDAVTDLVDAFAHHYRTEPGFRALWFGRHLTEWTSEADRRHKRDMAAGVHRFLVARRLLPESQAAATACYAAFLAADAVIQEAFRGDPDHGDELLDSLKSMLHAHLDGFPR